MGSCFDSGLQRSRTGRYRDHFSCLSISQTLPSSDGHTGSPCSFTCGKRQRNLPPEGCSRVRVSGHLTPAVHKRRSIPSYLVPDDSLGIGGLLNTASRRAYSALTEPSVCTTRIKCRRWNVKCLLRYPFVFTTSYVKSGEGVFFFEATWPCGL